MRILLLTPSVRALGARRSLVELVRALPPGIEPVVAVPRMDGIALELKELGIPLVIAPQGAWRKWRGRLTAWFHQLPALRQAIRHHQPDLLHANEFHIVPQALAASGGNRPVTAHVRLGITPRQVKTYRMAGCSRIVAVSGAVAGLFDGTPCRPMVRVVPNGVDVTRLASDGPLPPGVADWRARLGEIPAAGAPWLVAGLFGLVSERKNQLVAVEAIARCAAAGHRVALLLAGDAFKGSTPYGEKLRHLIAQPAVAPRVLWLPFQRDAAALYRAVDVNLLVSSEEGFGRTIIEAGALGKPSIGARTGGIPELIVEGETGHLIPPANAEVLARVLGALAANPAHLAIMGAAARDRVLRHYTIEAHARAVADLWAEALASS